MLRLSGGRRLTGVPGAHCHQNDFSSHGCEQPAPKSTTGFCLAWRRQQFEDTIRKAMDQLNVRVDPLRTRADRELRHVAFASCLWSRDAHVPITPRNNEDPKGANHKNLEVGAGRGSRTPKTRRSADFESAAYFSILLSTNNL